MLSIVVPIFNEEDNIPILCQRLEDVLMEIGEPYELVLVNDGSTDGSEDKLRQQAADDPRVKVLNLRRNYGQTAALMAGIDHASGDTIVAIDGDLQNDPADIPMLLDKLEEGFDVVSGWRQNRKDRALLRTLPSRVANRLISWISGVHLHDYGCTLKAYRRDVIKDVRLYGEMHRFIPIYASWQGGRITEVPVRHHPRTHGSSSYGLSRVFKVILDLVVVRFLDRYLVKPIYVFGGFGIIAILLSVFVGIYTLYLKFFEDISLILTPLPLLGVTLLITGTMSILMGLLAEMLVRTYFEAQKLTVYQVRDSINIENGSKCADLQDLSAPVGTKT